MTIPDLDEASEFFKALGSPTRLAILHALRTQPQGVTEIARALDVSQPLVSQHLSVLHGVRLVCRARHGREVRYRLADEHVAHLLEDVVTHIGEPAESDHEGEPHD